MKNTYLNKTIVITGASEGIGYELALGYSQLNCKIVIAARSEDKLSDLAKLIQKNGSEVLISKTDVTNEKDCENLITNTIKEFKTIDLLINNVGITSRSLIVDTKITVYKHLMETNFYGAVRITQKALPFVLKSRGTIVAVSSVIGKVPVPGRSAYSCSKHALESFFETLNMELTEKDITILTLRPSYTKTNTRKNAIIGDGSLQGFSTLDENKLLPASKAAKQIMTAIYKKKNGYTLGKKMEGSWLIKLYQMFPNKISKLIYKNLKQEKHSLFN